MDKNKNNQNEIFSDEPVEEPDKIIKVKDEPEIEDKEPEKEPKRMTRAEKKQWRRKHKAEKKAQEAEDIEIAE